MSIPVLLLKFREDDDLHQRMDDDYVRAFVPEIVDLKQEYRDTTAYIIPIEKLHQDQIDLLISRGAINGRARIVRFRYIPFMVGTHMRRREIDDLKLFDYVCLFKHYILDHRRWIEAYTMRPEFLMGLDLAWGRFSYGFAGYGGGFSAPPFIS